MCEAHARKAVMQFVPRTRFIESSGPKVHFDVVQFAAGGIGHSLRSTCEEVDWLLGHCT
jgi:hypothetical protein